MPIEPLCDPGVGHASSLCADPDVSRASGVRSSLAASLLSADGREVSDLRGGFAAWPRAVREVVSG